MSMLNFNHFDPKKGGSGPSKCWDVFYLFDMVQHPKYSAMCMGCC